MRHFESIDELPASFWEGSHGRSASPRSSAGVGRLTPASLYEETTGGALSGACMPGAWGDRPGWGSKTPSRLLLASSSKRRQELVGAFEQPVEVVSPAGDEEAPPSGESPEDFVVRLSLVKALGVGSRHGPAVVLAADTVVVMDGQIYGKPATGQDATGMLRRLKGRTHQVVTGLAALDSESGRWLTSATVTSVSMRHYSDSEAAAYVVSGEPFDKAGGYAIQDEDFNPVRHLAGCYLNVVGLPLCDLVGLLARLGADARLRPDWQPPDRCHECALRKPVEAAGP